MKKPEAHITLYYTQAGVVITARHRPARDVLRRRAGASPLSYAEELVDRFLCQFVGRSIELREEYRVFYAKEYSTVADFLYRKYAMSAAAAQQIGKSIDEGHFAGLSEGTFGRDWQLWGLVKSASPVSSAILGAVGASVAGVDDED